MRQRTLVLLALGTSTSLPAQGTSPTPSAPTSAPQRAAPLTPSSTLVAGRSVEDSLAAGGRRTYRITLGGGRFVRGLVQQRSVDAVVTIVAPDGRVLKRSDDSYRGPDPFFFHTTDPGTYELQVTGFEQQAGKFALVVSPEEPAATTPAGRAQQFLAAYGDSAGPGFAVAVVQHGRVLFRGGYGQANLEYGVPITPSTVFDAASVAKQFTAFGIALLHERGTLSLDDDVRKYIPELPDYGQLITVRHLVHHTSGVRDWIEASIIGGLRREDVTLARDVLGFAYRQRELNFAPGAEMSYSNTGYSLLARVIEVASGTPFPNWMAENVFGPLGMTSTRFPSGHGVLVPQRAQSYVVGADGSWQNISDNLSARGGSSLFTTADDFTRWLLNFGTHRVGTAATHQVARRPGVLRNGDSTAYAFGLYRASYRGLPRLEHDGGWVGYASMMHYYPSIDAGIVVLANSASPTAGRVADDLADTFFAQHLARPVPAVTGEARAASGGTSRGAAAPAWAPPATELTTYAGEYVSPELDAVYSMAVRDGRLVALHRRHSPVVLTPVTKDVFSGGQALMRGVRFERTAAGRVSGFRVSGGRVRNLHFGKRVSVAEPGAAAGPA
jgi:CubicO group peptidase (beta-lactamase class C family)